MPTPLSFHGKLREPLLESFSRDEFSILLKDELGVVYDRIVKNDSLENEFDEVIEWFDRRDKLPDLFRAASKARPKNKALADLREV